MREFFGTTHADPETVRRYAAGEVGFGAIAEDRGPREATTLDLLLDAEGFRRHVKALNDAREDV